MTGYEWVISLLLLARWLPSSRIFFTHTHTHALCKKGTLSFPSAHICPLSSTRISRTYWMVAKDLCEILPCHHLRTYERQDLCVNRACSGHSECLKVWKSSTVYVSNDEGTACALGARSIGDQQRRYSSILSHICTRVYLNVPITRDSRVQLAYQSVPGIGTKAKDTLENIVEK